MSDELIEVFNKVCYPEWVLDFDYGGLIEIGQDNYLSSPDIVGGFNLKNDGNAIHVIFAFNTPWQFWQKAFPGHNLVEGFNCEYESRAKAMFCEIMTSADPEKAILEALKEND